MKWIIPVLVIVGVVALVFKFLLPMFGWDIHFHRW
jgi:hypothetical protein